MSNEKWKNHPEFTDYESSNHGRIRRISTNKIFSLNNKRNGYLRFAIKQSDGTYKNQYFHRFIAECFLGKSELYINHIDHNKLNNNIENLEYVTQKENILKAMSYGKFNNSSMRHYSSKLDEYKILTISTLVKAGFSFSYIRKSMNFKRGIVRNISNGFTYKNFNYLFSGGK